MFRGRRLEEKQSVPGNLPIAIWVAIFTFGILIACVIYLFGPAWLKEIWGIDEE